jgi:hypothetical protein
VACWCWRCGDIWDSFCPPGSAIPPLNAANREASPISNYIKVNTFHRLCERHCCGSGYRRIRTFLVGSVSLGPDSDQDPGPYKWPPTKFQEVSWPKNYFCPDTDPDVSKSQKSSGSATLVKRKQKTIYQRSKDIPWDMNCTTEV